MIRRLTTLGILAALVSGCGGSSYAGMSKAEAIRQARAAWRDITTLEQAVATTEVGQKVERRIQTTDPVVTRSRCGTNEAWKVQWRPYFPMWVGARTHGIQFGETARNCI